jgi:hypothetical protein
MSTRRSADDAITRTGPHSAEVLVPPAERR